MQRAFILINCEPGSENSVIDKLKQTDCVTQAIKILGTYDVIAKVESDSSSILSSIISDQIRKIDRINSTNTLLGTGDEEGNYPDFIPDVIPDQKKPLEPPSKFEDNEFEDDFDDEDKDDYEETK